MSGFNKTIRCRLCVNNSDEGVMVGELCSPCHKETVRHMNKILELFHEIPCDPMTVHDEAMLFKMTVKFGEYVRGRYAEQNLHGK